MLRILSWNVQRLKAGAERVVEEIAKHLPNVVTLQEFQTGSTSVAVTKLLSELKLKPISTDQQSKGFTTAVFADLPGDIESTPDGLGNGAQWWSEAKFKNFGLSAVHIPTPSHYLRKRFWDSLVSHALSKVPAQHLIVGDFNTTRDRIDNDGAMVPGKQYLTVLAHMGWVDAWRYLYPEKHGFTWFSSAHNGFRLDQMWISPTLARSLQHVSVIDGPRTEGLSDHAVLIVDLQID